MARDGMSRNIGEIRLMCELGTADYSIAGVTYWTDNQIQEVLDGHRENIQIEGLMVQSEYTTGTVVYKDYYWRKPDVEEYDASNTEIFHLENAGGTAVGTANYTVNYEARHIRFSSDQLGSAYYLTYRSYDLKRAAAEIWRKKAGHVAQRFDVSSDNHNLRASQMVKQYLDMSDQYRKEAIPKFSRMVRTDVK